MRKYEELADVEKSKAFIVCLSRLLKEIVEGQVRFSDALNGDDLQGRIDEAWKKADDMKTPWFAHEYIMEVAGEDITGMAQCKAEDALYPDEDEDVVRI